MTPPETERFCSDENENGISTQKDLSAGVEDEFGCLESISFLEPQQDYKIQRKAKYKSGLWKSWVFIPFRRLFFSCKL